MKMHNILKKQILLPTIAIAMILGGTFLFQLTRNSETKAVGYSQGDILINEFVANPSSGGSWVELFNTTDNPIDLADWALAVHDAGGGTSYMLLSNLMNVSSIPIPGNGIVVITPTLMGAGAGLVLQDSTGTPIYSMSYGNVTMDQGEPHLDAPGVGESAFLTILSTWSVTGSPTMGWFNDAGQPGGAPLLSTIDSALSSEGIETNMGELDNPSATPATEGEGALYFEKVGMGKIVFEKVLNMSDQSTVAVLQSLGTAMEMSDGHVAFDSVTAAAMDATGARIYMYGLAYVDTPSIVIKDDAGNVLGTDDPTMVGDVSYDSGMGTLSFTAAHFTQFQAVEPIAPAETYIDDDYYDSDNDGGHNWGVDAFATIQEGINSVAEGGTVYVATGTYDEEIEINTPLITLEGDVGDSSAGPGENAPVINDMACENRTLNINANSVTVEGFSIVSSCNYASIRVANEISGANILDNELLNNYVGVGLSPFSSHATVMRNIIHDNHIGVSVGGSWDNTISNNDIYNNGINNEGKGIYFKCGNNGSDCDSSGTVASNNNIYDNAYGIYFDAGDQESAVTVGPGNDIHSNGDGIYVYGDAGNLVIRENLIHDNPGTNSGLHVENTTFLDASRNWWGDPSGPNVNDNGPGSGETITTVNSGSVFYRPFYTDEDCTILSTTSVTLDDLVSLFDSGVFKLPFGESDPRSVSSVEATEKVTITIPDGSSVEIPVGTIITADEGVFNASALSASQIDVATLANLGSGIVAKGALEWGISGLHLEFNPAIKLHIFVGTEANGQTLNIKRSTDGVTWTSDGIEDPKTCVVSGGICTFQATKASTYVSTSGGGSTPPAYSAPAQSQPGEAPSNPVNPTAPEVISAPVFNLTAEQLIDANYDYQIIAQSPYSSSLNHGEVANVWIEIKNTGKATWGDNVRLGSGSIFGAANQRYDYTSEVKNDDWLSINRASGMKDGANHSVTNIIPGWHIRFQFNIKAPMVNGTYKAYFTPVAENVTWMKDLGIYWEIKVKGDTQQISNPLDVTGTPLGDVSQGDQAGSYVVKAGDTLCSIAANVYGACGSWYKLVEKNGNTYSTLWDSPGVIGIGWRLKY